jgi:nucleotide-binding universal stress UspA family protein
MVPRTILVATDFQEPASRALELAATIAEGCGARLILVHAYDVPALLYADPIVARGAGELAEELEMAAEQKLDALAERLRPRVGAVDTVAVQGPPADCVLDEARKSEADLIVVGTHGRSGLPRAVLGSTAERLIRTSPFPVLVAHGAGPR